MAQPRALRRRARFAILALLVFIIWTTKPKRALRLRRDRADRVAHLDPELKREWDDDARADPLPPRCERELAGALPLDRLEGTLARSRLYGTLASGVVDRGLTAFDPAHAGDAQTQGLGLSSLFTFHPTTGKASPVLRRLDVPARAVVLPVPPRSAPRVASIERRVACSRANFHPPGFARRGRFRVVPGPARVPLQRVSRVASSRRTRGVGGGGRRRNRRRFEPSRARRVRSRR